MRLLDLLFNAASGGIIGTGLHLLQEWVSVWKADREQRRQIELLEAQARIRIEGAAWDAFSASQKPEDMSNVWPWAASIRVLMRPILTLLLLAFLAYAYIQAGPAGRAEMNGELQFASFTAIFWWFASRYRPGPSSPLYTSKR